MLISVVSPFFNEESNAREFCYRVKVVLEFNNWHYEIITVNDGSTDSTGKILEALSRENRNIRYINLAANRGQAIALFAGIQHSKGDYIVIMDSDLQHAPEEIPKFIRIELKS